MDLDLFKHREYQLGGVIGALIILFLSLGLSLTTLIVLAPLAFGAGYVFWRNKPPTSSGAESSRALGRSCETSSPTNPSHETTKQTGKKRRWKVTIGEEHKQSSAGNPLEDMDRSGLRGSLLTPSILSPGTRSRRSLHGSPVAQSAHRTVGLSPAPGSSGMPLPRVRRVPESRYNESGSILASPTQRLSILSPGVGPSSRTARCYPTHQPKYAGLGLMPPVHLQGPDRRVLSERNSSMLTSPVTVKIAPPDILKPPIPSIVPVEDTSEVESMPQHNPCDTQHVLSAIREKRKRTIKDDEVSQVVDSRDSKRRRQHAVTSRSIQEDAAGNNHDDDVPNSEVSSMDTGFSMVTSLKRPAISRSRAASIAQMEDHVVKRSRSAGPVVTSPATPGSTGCGRNPIEVSYSSSKRWLEKRQELEKSEGQSAKKRHTRSQSRDQSAKKRDNGERSANNSLTVSEATPALRLSPRRILSLVDQDTPMKDDSRSYKTSADEPIPSTSYTDNATDFAENAPQTPDVADIREKLFPLSRNSSSRRRHTQIRSDSNTDEFSKVPMLRYSLTTEDYEKDRVSEMKRVEQMLDDVEEAHAAKTAKTEGKASEAETTKTSTPSLTTSSGLLSGTATKITPLSAATSTFASTGLLGIGSSGSSITSMASMVGTNKPLSVTSPLVPGSLTSSAASPASITKSAVSTQSLSGVTSVTSISTPLLQTGATASGAGSNITPASMTGMNMLPSTSLPTSVTPQAGLGLATTTSTKLAANGTPATNEYSFPPLFGGTATSSIISLPVVATSTAVATSAVPSEPPPAYSSLSTLATATTTANVGFKFGGVATTTLAAPVSSSLGTTTTTAAPFSFDIAGAAATSTASSTASSTPGFSFNSTAPAAFGTPNASAVPSSTTTSISAGPSFSFGGGAPVSTTQSATFGTSLGGKPTTSTFGATSLPSSSGFGSILTTGVTSTAGASSMSGFGTTSASLTSPAFGSTTGSITTPFNAPVTANPTPAASSVFSFGGTTGQAGKSASPFGPPSSTMFGQASSATTPGTVSTTGNSVFGQQAAALSTGAFGQTSLTTSASSGNLFGGVPAKAAGNCPSPFGSTVRQTNGESQIVGFQFGVTAPTKTAISATQSTFQFGGSAPTSAASTTAQASPFAFGGQAPSTTTNKPGVIAFGHGASSAAPAFGTATTATNNAFAASDAPSAFGSSNTSSLFGAGANINNSSLAFSQPGTQGTQNAFGVGANKTAGAFGSASSMTQPAFGVGTTSTFGGQQQPATGGFGAPDKTQPGKGFDFSASSKPTINFGGAPQPTQAVPQQSGFAFGAANSQNQDNSGFNFNTGSSNAFGMTAPGTPQMGSQTPAFGTPNTNPTATPNPFSPPGTQGQGAFTIGSGNVQPRPRSMVRAARRRTTKR